MRQAKTTFDKIETILSYLKTTIEPCQKSALSQAGGGPFLRLSHGGPPPPRTLYARTAQPKGCWRTFDTVLKQTNILGDHYCNCRQ